MTQLISEKTILNIYGRPCSGKSTLVEKILKQQGVYCVDYDVVKRQLSGYYWKRDAAFARQLTIDVLGLAVKSDKPLLTLLPSPSSRDEYDYYFEAAHQAGYRIIDVVTKIDKDVLIDRYKQRLVSIRKHNPDFRVKTLDEFVATFDDPVYIIPGGRPGVIERLSRTWLYHDDAVALFEQELDSGDDFRVRFGYSDNPGPYWSDEVYCWNRQQDGGES